MKKPKLPKLLVFASGSEEGGGSGFEKLFEATQTGVIKGIIVAVVSNHRDGGVRERANRLGVDFIHSPKERTKTDYETIAKVIKPDFIALSGWLGFVEGLDPKITFNIHPAWLPSPFGGKGFHGHHVHEAVIAAYRREKIKHSGVSMHFVTPEYDKGPIFFRRRVEIFPDDTADTLQKRVNAMEHKWQAIITNLVIQGKISWDGINPESLVGSDIEE